MGGYTKLFSSIVTSTIWEEDLATRVVWVAMLAMKNWDGIVEGSIPGFARLANVTVPELEKALKVLMSPDPYSRTPDNEGRRIEAIAGGWLVLNHENYNYKGSEDHKRSVDMERQRRHRKKNIDSLVTPCHALSRHIDLNKDKDLPPNSPKTGELPPAPIFQASKFKDPPVLDNSHLVKVTATPPESTQSAVNGDSSPLNPTDCADIPQNQRKGIPARSLRFVPPTPAEVTAYAQEIGAIAIRGAAFVDHYVARGWCYGRGKPMVDWKAAVRTWKHRDADTIRPGGLYAKTDNSFRGDGQNVESPGARSTVLL